MRIYASRPRPARFHGFGQADAPAPAALLPVLLPGATPVTGYDETVQARDRLVFRKNDQLFDIAYLGTIAPPVTIGATRGVSSILLGYVYGPNAGKALYVPLEDFYRQGWRVVDARQEGAVWEAGGIYKKPVYPYTVEDLNTNLDLIESWIKSGVAQAEAGNIVGAKHSLSMVHDNINNAWYRLNAVRDSGLPSDIVEAFEGLIRGMSDKSAPLQTAINEANAGLMARLGRALWNHFSSDGAKINSLLSDKQELIKKKIIETYRLRQTTDRLLREILRLPQGGDMPRIAAALASELALTNRGVAAMEAEAAQYGMKLSTLFDIPQENLSDLGLAWVKPVIWLIAYIVVDIIIRYLTDRFATKHADVMAKDEVQKANKISQSALVELIRLNFEKVMTDNPTLNFEKAKELALEYARISAQLTNVEELKQIVDPKLLRTLTDVLAKKGITVGPLPGQPGYRAPGESASSDQDDQLILVIAGIVILGPILASLLRKN